VLSLESLPPRRSVVHPGYPPGYSPGRYLGGMLRTNAGAAALVSANSEYASVTI
jgi:hypothetical protein